MAEVNVELANYFSTNCEPDSSPMTVWEAYKPFIRGIFIKHRSRLKRSHTLWQGIWPDGLPSSYYKSLEGVLVPHFLNTFNSLDETHGMGVDTLRAQITLIPKEGKDHTERQIYRPISLLNVDLKLLTRIVASCLAPELSSLIRYDQVGFIPMRESRDSVTRDLIHTAKARLVPFMSLPTDAEKVFDRVNSAYMEVTLDTVCLSDRMESWIHILGSHLTAQVKVYGLLSNPLNIMNGTRQGCPLSPLLFALTMEPFQHLFRADPSIHGIQIPTLLEQKVAAYADDMLFFVSQPHISLPRLLKAFENFGTNSNFKINLQKSEAMNISLPNRVTDLIRPNFSFMWSGDCITCLGAKILCNLANVYARNFPPLLASLKSKF